MSQLNIVLKDIEDNKARIAKVEAELERTKDPARRERLEDYIRLLRECILILEKRALLLTLAQGKASFTLI